MKNILKPILSLILFFFIVVPYVNASHTTDPGVLGLQSKISNIFTRKYCKAINNGFSKDEAMSSAIIETENIIAFSINPQKKWIGKNNLADQIAIKVVNNCGWSFGLTGRNGIEYFKKYFLEVNDKITPNKNLSG